MKTAQHGLTTKLEGLIKHWLFVYPAIFAEKGTGVPTTSKFGVEDLIQLSGADKAAKSYAFLHAAFRRTEVGSAPVRHAIDCINPFVVAFLASIPGKRIDPTVLKIYLKQTFGFDIPLYAFEQIFPKLHVDGYLDYNRTAHAYLAKKQDGKFETIKAEIEFDFGQIENALAAYPPALSVGAPPVSKSWGDALVNFLKGSTEPPRTVTVKIKGQLVDPVKVEASIVSGFVRQLHDEGSKLFDTVIQIFMGVLIEDFISAISEIGQIKATTPLVVFYDTTVLLRLLGCSGRILRTATEELNRYLQDLGFSTHYFSGNEGEAANILNAIISAKDTGREIEGETAEAVSSGEISVSELRALVNLLPETLAGLNVFPGDNFEGGAQREKAFQIDEQGFAGYLLEQANKAKRAYGVTNRLNDAGYLGNIVRLRKNIRTRDLTDARFIFITSNNFLASSAKRYLIRERMLNEAQCPPMLSVGQAATIAWLLKDQKLAPEKAGRELLSNCFAAVRPDAEWFTYFREGMEKQVGGLEEYLKVDANSLVVQAARKIARDESFGSSVLVRELNMAEILSRAKIESERLIREKEQRTQEEIQAIKVEGIRAAENAKAEGMQAAEAAAEQLRQAKVNAEAERVSAVSDAIARARQEVQNELLEAKRQRSHRLARDVIKIGLLAGALLFAGCAFLAWWEQGEATISIGLWVASAILSIVALLTFFDLVGLPIVKTAVSAARETLANRIFRWL